MYLEIMPKLSNLPVQEIEQDILLHFGNAKDLVEISEETTLIHNDEKLHITPVGESNLPDAARDIYFSFLVFVDSQKEAFEKWRSFPWKVVTKGLFYDQSNKIMFEFNRNKIRQVFREDLQNPDATYGSWIEV